MDACRGLTELVAAPAEENAEPPPGQRAEAFRPAFLIPDHNHQEAISSLLDQLEPLGRHCLIVDDGSAAATQRHLVQQAKLRPWVRVIRRSEQGGKGAAVMTGLRALHESGFTHAVQLDADGQHDPTDAALFLGEARAFPEALILGRPTYGIDVPRVRLAGRQLSRVLVWLETLSFDIGDPLLGYRVYPLRTTMELVNHQRLGTRMDFDPEIAVRLSWCGVPVRNIATRVFYPPGGLSHFRMLADNLRMVWLHVRLLAGMFRRLPLRTGKGKI